MDHVLKTSSLGVLFTTNQLHRQAPEGSECSGPARNRAGPAQERPHPPLRDHSTPAHTRASMLKPAPEGQLHRTPYGLTPHQQDWSLGEGSWSAAQEGHRTPLLQWPLLGSHPCGCMGPAHGQRAPGGGQAALRPKRQDTGPSTGPTEGLGLGSWRPEAGERGARGDKEVNQGSNN